MEVSTIIALAVTTIVTTIVGLVVRNVAAGFFARVQNRRANRRAHARITAQTDYKVGDVIVRAYAVGVARPRYCKWFIASMDVGRYVLREIGSDNKASPRYTRMSGAEFEAHDFVITDRYTMEGTRLREVATGRYADEEDIQP